MNVGLGPATTAMPAHYYAVAAVTIILALFIMLGDLLILMFHQFCPGSYPFPLQYMPPPYAMQQSLYEHEKIPPEIVIVMDASIIPSQNARMGKMGSLTLSSVRIKKMLNSSQLCGINGILMICTTVDPQTKEEMGGETIISKMMIMDAFLFQ